MDEAASGAAVLVMGVSFAGSSAGCSFKISSTSTSTPSSSAFVESGGGMSSFTSIITRVGLNRYGVVGVAMKTSFFFQ
jgi:hypothetical protein